MNTTAASPLSINPDSPWLAPLAGFSDLPFRLLCRGEGASVACTEMVSAKGLIYGLKRKEKGGGTEDLLVTTTDDTPLVVQLFGEDPDFLAQAVEVLRERGFSYFDLNMGCSVPKVCKSGAGAALLRDPAQALAVAGAMLKAAEPGCAGCKIRLGWDASSEIYLDLAKALEDAGSAWITLHPRFARQGFGGSADTAALEKLSRRVDIPVLASGDLFSAEDAIRRLETGVRSVMFARGALSNPAIFRRYLAIRQGTPLPGVLPPEELLALIRRHAKLARLHCPEKKNRKRRAKNREVHSGYEPALLKMRTMVPRYVRHLPGVKYLRQSMARCESWDGLENLLRDFFSALPTSNDEK